MNPGLPGLPGGLPDLGPSRRRPAEEEPIKSVMIVSEGTTAKTTVEIDGIRERAIATVGWTLKTLPNGWRTFTFNATLPPLPARRLR